MDLNELVEYEISSSWWAGWVWFDWGQELIASYMIWKTRRKIRRYTTFLKLRRKGQVLKAIYGN